MSLVKQIWLLMVMSILVAVVASFCLHLWIAKSYIETQLQLKNHDNAQSLALTLSQFKGEAHAARLALAAQFDTGHYESIRWVDEKGQDLAFHQSLAGIQDVPKWFVVMLPISSAVGVAQISDQWKSLGTLFVVSHVGFAYQDLWRGTVQSVFFMAVLSVCAGLVAFVSAQRLHRPLDETVEQARALVERRFITVDEPKTPELARLSQAMNIMVSHVRTMYEEQIAQAERLRREANCDALTGLSHRRQFLSQLQSALDAEGGAPGESVILVRILRLSELNRILGYQQTDVILRDMAQKLTAMASPAQRVGRLNGSDFAVCVMDSTADQRAALLNELSGFKSALQRQAASANIAVCKALAPLSGYASASLLLTDLDAALARSEHRGDFSLEIVTATDAVSTYTWGTEAWRTHLMNALHAQRAQLVEYRVVDERNCLIHRECPLRLELVSGQGYQAATVWLPFALRAGLMPTVDLMATTLALKAIEDDGVPRGINLSSVSLHDSAFVPNLRQAIEQYPGVSYLLWLEIGESAMSTDKEQVRELCSQMQALGVKVGLEHVGSQLTALQGLLELGLAYVKLDAAMTQGMATDASQANYVNSVVRMLKGVGVSVFAEGVQNKQDAQALWRCGIDGMTGPWIG